MYNTILFDFDGTLFDSGEGILNSLRHALTDAGITFDKLDPNKLIGPLISEGLKNSFPNEFKDEKFLKETVQVFRKHYAEIGVHQCVMYAGIEVLLKNLRDKEKHIIIATSKPTVFAEQILKKYNLHDHFSLVMGNDLNTDLCTKTQIISQVLEKNSHRNKSEMVMVGDRYHDIVGAKENGLAVIGVTYGYGSKEEIMAHSPNHIAENVAELGKLLV